jgi:hypothetical protein
MASNNDLEQVLRQNLKLRREPGAAVTKAKSSGSRHSLAMAGAEPEKASGDEGLEALRLELKLRRAADPAPAKTNPELSGEERLEELDDRVLRTVWKAWAMFGLVGLAFGALVGFWLIY